MIQKFENWLLENKDFDYIYQKLIEIFTLTR